MQINFSAFSVATIRYDTIGEFNVDSDSYGFACSVESVLRWMCRDRCSDDRWSNRMTLPYEREIRDDDLCRNQGTT